MTKKQKRQIYEKVSKYFSECSSYEMWRDCSNLFAPFFHEINWYKSIWNENGSCEEYKQVLEVQKAASQLAELLKKYSELHAEPKERPFPQEIRMYFDMS